MAISLPTRTQIDFDRQFPTSISSPALTRSSTVPTNLGGQRTDRSHLAPEDAFYAHSPPRRIPPAAAAAAAAAAAGGDGSPLLRQRKRNGGLNGSGTGTGTGHRSRKRRRSWKKLLWVDRVYPDNYTDQATFLEQLQRNPRLQPYDFWPLVADTTIIVQHVCSVIIFIVAFVAIFQERVTHISIVSYSSGLTFLGWLLWERWVADAEDREEEQITAGNPPPTTTMTRGGSRRRTGSIRRRATLLQEARAILPTGLGITTSSSSTTITTTTTTKENLNAVSNRLQESSATSHRHHNHHPPRISANGNGAPSSSSSTSHLADSTSTTTRPSSIPTPRNNNNNSSGRGTATTTIPETLPPIPQPNRAHERLATIKSAVLISSILLGLSPILKSLTRSTSSDSIWAMCFFLLTINILFFDYSGDVSGANFPASLSTNAALMASTMLASRLPSTGQVFSLTVLSIEVFGLFPVFRRYARHRPWRYHVLLTGLLVLLSGAGVGLVLGDVAADASRTARNCLLGMLMGAVVAALAMGGCSWWLIGLQKYKNEINGPWDAARPVIISRRYY